MKLSEIKAALLEMGFEESGRYFKKGGLSIKIYKSTTLKDVFEQMFKQGELSKTWQIQKALGL